LRFSSTTTKLFYQIEQKEIFFSPLMFFETIKIF
jgi:hypothetical protein